MMSYVVSVRALEYIDYFEIIGVYKDEEEADLAKLRWFVNGGTDVDDFGFRFYTRVMTPRQLTLLRKLCGQELDHLEIQNSESGQPEQHPHVEEIYEMCTA